MSTRGDPSATGRRVVFHLRVEIRGPLGCGEPQRAVLFSAPVDVPDERPLPVELGISLKPAKTLGLMIPQSTLIRADEVIQ